MEKDDGGFAFPVPHVIDGNWVISPHKEYSGMSLRDYFAAAALQQLVAFELSPLGAYQHICPESARTIAAFAYDIGDAMLAERNKP